MHSIHPPVRLLSAALIASATFANAPLFAQSYVVTDLGTGDGNFAFGAAISHSGKVAGYWYLVGEPFYYDPTTPAQAALWDHGSVNHLAPLPSHTHTFAYAMNIHLQAVGQSCRSNGKDCHNVVWNGDTPTDLGVAGDSALLAINDAGEIAGYLQGASPRVQRAAVWVDGHHQALPTLPHEANSAASGINNARQIVGVIDVGDSTTQIEHAILWEGATIHDLQANSVANAINEPGQVVGYAIASDDSYFHATRWFEGKTTDLGTLGGTDSQANAINDAGAIVGWSMIPSGTEDAALWIDGKIIDLNSLLPPTLASTYQLTSATAINAKGQIVTLAYSNVTFENHIFLLTPTSCTTCD